MHIYTDHPTENTHIHLYYLRFYLSKMRQCFPDSDFRFHTGSPVCHRLLKWLWREMAVKETTALIVTRYAFFRQALRVYLENIGGIRVAASADNGLEALSLSEQMRPDLLIADAQCPGIDKLQESFLSKKFRFCSVNSPGRHDNSIPGFVPCF
jgi:hypothetical protein